MEGTYDSRYEDNTKEYEKELVITDRRIFLDDRNLDGELKYGMVCVTKK